MRLGEGLRRHGFRKWYERELTRGHLGLVLLLLSTVGLLASFELVGREMPLANRLGALVLMLVCSAIAVHSTRRYVFVLMRAEHVARQAVCPQCQTFGRLSLEHDDPQSESLQVSCRKCCHAWRITDPAEP
jgi:hypothetical protein